MRLPNNVNSEPFWWKLFPQANGRTIANTIYLKKEIFKDLQAVEPKTENLAILIHEQTHVSRINKTGLLKYSFLYLFSREFRFSEELEASKKAFIILKKNKLKVDLDRKARVLSSWKYLWSVNYQFGKKELEKAWELA